MGRPSSSWSRGGGGRSWSRGGGGRSSRGRGSSRGKGKGRAAPRMTWTRDKAAADKRAELPVAAYKAEVVALCGARGAVVITGDAGCGKSTQVPQYVMDGVGEDAWGRKPRVLVTQPRRCAAVAVARRVAAERGEAVGASVGYHVSGEKAGVDDGDDGSKAKCVYMTTGVLLQLLTHHRAAIAENYTHVVVDEAHERDVDMDLVLVTLRRLARGEGGVEGPRPTIVIMSATVDAARLAQFFGGADGPAPHLRVGTRPHEVRIHHLEDVVAATKDGEEAVEPWDETRPTGRSKNARFEPAACRGCVAFLKALAAAPELGETLLPPGDAAKRRDVLVFVPGVAEIEELEALCRREGLGRSYEVLPLHGALDDDAQRAALSSPDDGRAKPRVVITTNIAESSVTVPGVRVVIDFGLEKLPVYDPRTRTQALLTRHCSRASAAQRAGRCGRVASGACVRLYSKETHDAHMPPYIAPEIVRAPLPTVALKALLLDSEPARLLSEALDAPDPREVVEALMSLVRIGCVRGSPDAGFGVEPLGELVARLDIDANVGRLLAFGAALGCVDDMAVVAASVSLRDVFLQPFEARPPRKDGEEEEVSDVGDAKALSLDQAKKEVAHFAPRRNVWERAQYSDALATVAILREFKRKLDHGSRDDAARYARSNHASFKRLVEVDALARRLASTYDRVVGLRVAPEERKALGRSRARRGDLARRLSDRPALATTVRKFALLCCFAPCVSSAVARASDPETRGVVVFRLDPPPAEDDREAGEAAALEAFGAWGATACRVYREGDAMDVEQKAPAPAPPAAPAAAPPPAADAPVALLDVDGLSEDGDKEERDERDREERDFDAVYEGLDAKPDDDGAAAGDSEWRLEVTTRSAKDAAAVARCAGVRASVKLPLRDGSHLHLRDPRLSAPTLAFERPGARACVEATWSSPSARHFVDPYESAATKARYLVAPFYSARGASKSRQLAHQPTLLPAEPKGAAELLLLAAARDARWVAADSALVGAELFAPGSPDELRVALPLRLDETDVDLLNGVRRALSRAVAAPDGAPGAAVDPLLALLDREDREELEVCAPTLADALNGRSAARSPALESGGDGLLGDLRAFGGGSAKRAVSDDDDAESGGCPDPKRARLDDF